jgi:hypothetical protein
MASGLVTRSNTWGLTKKLSQPTSIALVSFILFLSWLILILVEAGPYQNAAGLDPLAMINILFPSFWILLIAFAILCFVTFTRIGENRLLHILLLSEFSIMLFYTPFLLGGFSWSPDSLWHGGIASYMPDVLKGSFEGSEFSVFDYAHGYPLSFLVTYVAERLLGVDVLTYTLYIFPPITIFLISTLSYFFIFRMFSARTAFLSMLMALPCLHYIEPHVSPYALGTVLTLASLILLTYRGAKTLVLSCVLIILLVITHPISPIFLGIYMFASLIMILFFRIKTISSLKLITQAPRIMFLFASLIACWFGWTLTIAATAYPAVGTSLGRILNSRFLIDLLSATEWTLSAGGGGQFVYSEISQLGLGIYAAFLFVVLIVFLRTFIKFLRSKQEIEPVIPKQMALALAAFASAAMGFILFASSGERFLLGRGLFFFLIFGSACIVASVVGTDVKRSMMKNIFLFGSILLLVSTFPVVSYSKEAYNTFTPSANTGLSFIGKYIEISDKTTIIGFDQQLVSYVNLKNGFQDAGDRISVTKLNITAVRELFSSPADAPDLVVLRSNMYYIISMRYASSFTNNSYTQIRDVLANNPLYMRIYSNPNFEAYLKTKNP